jgi:hypothetical protein
MKNIFKLLVMNIRSLGSPEISEPLSWSKEDFEKAKKWGQSRLYPGKKYRTVWDVVYSPRYDTVDVISEINQLIIIENKNKQIKQKQ